MAAAVVLYDSRFLKLQGMLSRMISFISVALPRLCTHVNYRLPRSTCVCDITDCTNGLLAGSTTRHELTSSRMPGKKSSLSGHLTWPFWTAKARLPPVSPRTLSNGDTACIMK